MEKELIKNLLLDKRCLLVAEEHILQEPKHFIVSNIKTLKEFGVTDILLEHISHELLDSLKKFNESNREVEINKSTFPLLYINLITSSYIYRKLSLYSNSMEEIFVYMKNNNDFNNLQNTSSLITLCNQAHKNGIKIHSLIDIKHTEKDLKSFENRHSIQYQEFSRKFQESALRNISNILDQDNIKKCLVLAGSAHILHDDINNNFKLSKLPNSSIVYVDNTDQETVITQDKEQKKYIFTNDFTIYNRVSYNKNIDKTVSVSEISKPLNSDQQSSNFVDRTYKTNKNKQKCIIL